MDVEGDEDGGGDGREAKRPRGGEKKDTAPKERAKRGRDGAAPKGKGGGGGGARNNPNPPHWKDAMSLLMTHSRELSHLNSILLVTIIMPVEHRYITASLNVGRQYNEKTRRNPKHQLGPPHLHIFAAWMSELLLREDLLTEERKVAETAMTLFDSDANAMAAVVKVARVGALFHKDGEDAFYRIQWNLHPTTTDLTRVLRDTMVKDGGTEKLTSAPRGPRERRIEKHLRGDRADGNDDE